MCMIGNPRIPQRNVYWQKFFMIAVPCPLYMLILWFYGHIQSLHCTFMQWMILQCMILLAGILCISSILQEVKQRNGGMGRKHLLHCKPSLSPSWYSSWSYSLFIIAFVISFVFYFCKFQQHGTKRQEVGTVKGVVWEEERLPIQHIFYSNRILLAIITMQGMISHTMYSQWCLK